MPIQRLLTYLMLPLVFASSASAQEPGVDSELIKTIDSFQRLLEKDEVDLDRDSVGIFSEDGFEELTEKAREARSFCRMHEASDIVLDGANVGSLVYELPDGEITIKFQVTDRAPFLIDKMSIVKGASNGFDPLELNWDQLEEQLDQAAEQGFEGAVLVTRNGQVAFEKAYGFANREKQILNSMETIFAVGSAPIDFTHAGILLLKDDGKLSLEDSISKYFENVPADKQSITIRHLMQGTSGLRDFHDLPGDKNRDHSWIDRDEAVKRILAHEMLFEPGADHSHSHSAWGLLAAVIEIASGESYQQFTTERLFKPAGMNDTGFFGQGVSEDRIAVGYGRKSSEPNSPPHWGKTSWLVMGSGGQTSTLGDMHRWLVAMQNGSVLSPESTRQYLRESSGIHANGDMFGFEFIHSTEPDQLFMIISNSVKTREDRKYLEHLARSLEKLVEPEKANTQFTLGVVLGVANSGVVVQRVLTESAAETNGLQVGDVLLKANGQSLDEDPAGVLTPLLHSDSPIEFELRRGDENIKRKIIPLPRK